MAVTMQFPKIKKEKSTQKNRSEQMVRILRLWGSAIYYRDGGICQYCRKPIDYKQRSPHHIVERGTCPKPSWVDLNNGVLLCRGCHFYYAHGMRHNQKCFDEFIWKWLNDKGQNYEAMQLLYGARGSLKGCYDILETMMEKEVQDHKNKENS